jgi:putative oxidoreductase
MNRERAERIGFFLLRFVTGLVFLQFGGMKLLGWFGGMPNGMKIPLVSELGLAGILELLGGILIMIGLGTRGVAFILSGEMAVAYFQGHQPHGLSPVQNQGVPAVLFCFIFLYLATRGGGEYSVDALISRRRMPHQERATEAA